MKSDGEIMEILAAYDLLKSFRGAAELTGYSHHTVARHVDGAGSSADNASDVANGCGLVGRERYARSDDRPHAPPAIFNVSRRSRPGKAAA